MANCTKWCPKNCGKKVIYSPSGYTKDMRNIEPFLCMCCKSRFSHEDLGIVKRGNPSMYVSKNPKKVESLKKLLRVRNVFMSMKNRRIGGLHYES